MARPKNSPNKTTKEARELYLDILNNEAEHITSAFIELRKESAYKYLQTVLKLSQLVIPRPTDANINVYEHKPFDIKEVFRCGV